MGTPQPRPKSKQEINETHARSLLQTLSTSPGRQHRSLF